MIANRVRNPICVVLLASAATAASAQPEAKA
jgi:hypothetical protein